MAGRRKKRSPVTIGIVALVVSLIVLFLGFTKDIPFTRPFEIKAVFQSANSIRASSPVRIAGVEVGKVKAVEAQPGTNAAVVTMSIKKDGLPIHADATAKIRPRIFLEGNFFVDLKPGTPTAPNLDDGDTIKVTQTATPVQLDEVLTSLQSDSRQDLKDLLDGLAVALNSKPTAAQDADSDPSARGQTAAESFNDAYDDIPAAERSTSQVFEALLGIEPTRDVARLITGTARTTGALIRNENALQGLISNFNTTVAALASESGNLRASIRELAPTLTNANGALSALNASFPPTRAFAREILPGVRETPATIDASFPWIAQTRKLVSSEELGGLVRQLSPATADLARVTDRTIQLLPLTDLVSKCVRNNILPTGDLVIDDEFRTGAPNYKEFLWSLVGLAGEGQNFDGNGSYVRFQTGGGSQQLSVGKASGNSGQVFGNNVAVPLGNRPFSPGKRPPYRPDVPCYTQKLPEVNGPASAKSAPGKAPGAAAPTPPPTPTVVPGVPTLPTLPLPALRKHLRPFGDKTATGAAR
jgi:phospholipid/cholesterol/gamma-HCH transport system substrate-binding protein